VRADTSPARRARAMKSFEQRDWKTNIGRCANETCHLEKGCINVLLHLKIVFFQNESQICAHVQMLGICDEVDTFPANGGGMTICRMQRRLACSPGPSSSCRSALHPSGLQPAPRMVVSIFLIFLATGLCHRGCAKLARSDFLVDATAGASCGG